MFNLHKNDIKYTLLITKENADLILIKMNNVHSPIFNEKNILLAI